MTEIYVFLTEKKPCKVFEWVVRKHHEWKLDQDFEFNFSLSEKYAFHVGSKVICDILTGINREYELINAV